MARHFVLILKDWLPVLTTSVVLNLATVMSFGQATPCCNPPTYTPPTYTPNSNVYQPTPPSPGATWNPGSTSAPNLRYPLTSVDLVKAQDRYNQYAQPNPYVSPTREQTEWYVNSHPALSTLDWQTRQQLINGGWQATTILNQQYLGSRENPFYQSGRVIPNWYLPSTWSGGSWLTSSNSINVQPNGFAVSSYNPSYDSSFTLSRYSSGISSVSSTYNYNYQPSYQPPPLPRPSAVPPTSAMPLKPQVAPLQSSADLRSSSGSRLADLKKAVDDRERAIAVHEAAGDKVAQAIDHAELARLYAQNDKREQASSQLAIAEGMVDKVGDLRLQADLNRDDASTNMLLGEFEQSIPAYRKAMQILRSLGDERGQAEVYASEGWVFQSLGNSPTALSCYEAALYLFDKLGDKDGAARIRIGIGSIYQSIGDFETALLWYGKALPDASRDEQVRIHVRIAEMYLSRNEPIDALHRYEDALPLIQSSDSPALEGTILAGIGRCYMALDSYRATPETRKFLERARESMKDAGNRGGEAAVIASIGELNYWIAISSPTVDPKSRFSEALRNYNEALLLMQDVGDIAGQIGVLTNIGLVFDAWGKYPKALGYYLQALQKMEELQAAARIDEFRIDIAGQSAALYQRAILLEVVLNRREEAFNLSERARARNFLDQLGNRRINRRLPSEFVQREEGLRKENISLQRRIAQELSRPGPDVDQERIVSLELQRSSIQRQYSNLMGEAKLKNPEYESFLSIVPLTLREAQAHLAPDETVISYFTMPTVTLAFVLTKHSFHLSELPVTEAQLAWSIATFLDFSGESGVPPSLKALHKWLIEPVKSKLKTPRLAVVPYGLLHLVPFAALTPDSKRYVSDEYAVFSLPSLSALPYIRASNTRTTKKAVVFANNQDEGLSYLGHAYDEALEIASFFDTQPILGGAATAVAFQKSAGDYDIIHLIAHIDHDQHNPYSSRVILGHGKSDGDLELDQVLGLDLRKTSLVVLSGCQSQAGKWSRGDDIIGLSRAFIYAGSPSVMASLWSVDDEATRALMVSFYTHLKQGLSKAESLRRAQMELRQRYPHP